MSTNNKKILIIKLSSLGDVIFNVPLANALKDDGYEVSWLVSEKGLDIVNENPSVDKVFLAPFDKWKKRKNKFQNIKEFFELIKQIRAENYDIALDTQMRLKSLPFLRFCGAKRRIIAKDYKEFSNLGANEFIPAIKEGDKLNIVKCYLKFAKHLGINTNEIKITLPTSNQESIQAADELLKDIDKSKRLIIIAPATTWRGKHWNKENWTKLVRELEKDFTLIFTGTAKDNALINEISQGKHLNLAGKTNLKTLIEILRRTDLLISLDSGTTHLGWAAQNPKIVSIFCCTPSSLYAPTGSNKYIALQSEVCTPCHHKKCPLKDYRCTNSPSVDNVLKEVNNLLSERLL